MNQHEIDCQRFFWNRRSNKRKWNQLGFFFFAHSEHVVRPLGGRWLRVVAYFPACKIKTWKLFPSREMVLVRFVQHLHTRNSTVALQHAVRVVQLHLILTRFWKCQAGAFRIRAVWGICAKDIPFKSNIFACVSFSLLWGRVGEEVCWFVWSKTSGMWGIKINLFVFFSVWGVKETFFFYLTPFLPVAQIKMCCFVPANFLCWSFVNNFTFRISCYDSDPPSLQSPWDPKHLCVPNKEHTRDRFYPTIP